jgi:hypothetical protein
VPPPHSPAKSAPGGNSTRAALTGSAPAEATIMASDSGARATRSSSDWRSSAPDEPKARSCTANISSTPAAPVTSRRLTPGGSSCPASSAATRAASATISTSVSSATNPAAISRRGRSAGWS